MKTHSKNIAAMETEAAERLEKATKQERSFVVSQNGVPIWRVESYELAKMLVSNDKKMQISQQ